MLARLQQWAAERGYHLACGDIGVLQEVRAELEQRRNQGEFDSRFERKRLSFFEYEKSSEAIAAPRAVLMLAVPRPAHRLVFELASGPFETILPPIYYRYSKLFEEVGEDLCAAVPGLRCRLGRLLAPLKPIACRLGLARYGRNNITYVSGCGSYFQLLGYVTDADLGVARAADCAAAQLMAECEGCEICVSACPTGALSEDRVLAHAEHCTAYFSEESELECRVAPPCLFGCLVCQQICPVNRDLLRVEPAGVSFDCSETELILAQGADEAARLSATMREKLAVLALEEQSLIGRNLRHLIAAAGPGR